MSSRSKILMAMFFALELSLNVDSPKRSLWNAEPGPHDYSGLMLAARITLPHFSVSSAMSFPKSAGEPLSTLPPKSASRALILG